MLPTTAYWASHRGGASAEVPRDLCHLQAPSPARPASFQHGWA